MPLFDAHAHLPAGNSSTVPASLPATVCSTCEADFEPLRKLCEALGNGIVPAFGIHPWFAHTRSKNWRERLQKFLAGMPGSQIGEIGIDKTHAELNPKEIQIEIFEAQLELATKLCVPVVIHCVGWWGDMMKILRSRKILPTMLFHGFSGSAEIAKELCSLGCTFSFSMRQLATPSPKIFEVLKTLPRERVFAESDAPLGERSRELLCAAEKKLRAIYANFMNEKQTPQALFLDRDGTLIFDKDYLHDPAEVELIPGTKEAIQRVLKSGCKIFLLTNQSGIGRGFFTMKDYSACHARFLELLGINSEDFSACGVAPEHPNEPSRYRKPSPAFVLEQLAAFPQLDPARCWMIGDRRSDWDCGLNAKIRSAAVATGKPIAEETRGYLDACGIPLFPDFATFVNKNF